MDTKTLSIIALTVLGFIIQYFGIIVKMKEQIRTLETKMELFWNMVGKNIGELLKTYPTYLAKDVLIDKMIDGVMTEEEARTLKTILIGEMEKDKPEKRLLYVLVIGRLEDLLHTLNSKKEQKGIWKKLLSSLTL
jgi:hypothetical protein